MFIKVLAKKFKFLFVIIWVGSPIKKPLSSINCEFLNDIESLFYTFLDSANLYPSNLLLTNEINDLVTSRILVGKVGNYLFMNSDGGQLSKNNLSQILIRASNKYIEGSPNVSTTMIRKMLASDLSAVKNVKAKLLSERMKHSLGVHNMVYVKSHKPQ